MATEDSGVRRLGRRASRILAVQVIYAYDVSPLTDFATHWSGIIESLELKEEMLTFAREVAEGTIGHLLEINQTLVKFFRNWSLERVGKVTMAVLRGAVYELMYRDDIPHAVTINEAIDLVRMFGEDDAAKFVNGVLDSVSRHISAGAGRQNLGSPEKCRCGEEREDCNRDVENDLSAVKNAGRPFPHEGKNFQAEDEIS
jgi:N utilization substance protein B